MSVCVRGRVCVVLEGLGLCVSEVGHVCVRGQGAYICVWG